MSVPNESPVNTYTGNGTTTKFPVTFQFETQNTLVLKVNGSVAPISDYYWTSDSSFNFYTAPASGTVIEILRNTPKERDNDYDDNYNTFRPKTLNKDFDRIWRVIQEYLIKIDRNKQGLAQEILDRIQADADMLDYIMNQDNAIKQDYISRDAALKNYIDQMIALITGDPSFNGIDAQFVKDESGLSQQEWNNGVESIADLLAIPNPKNGNRVYVKGYYKATNFALDQPYKGGGAFNYVASMSSVNNGVTVLNGWVRDTRDKLLTTDDAGLLGDGADVNPTVRLQNLFNAVGDGFTVQIKGKYTINRHIVAYNKKDLKIVGVDSDVKGDPDNWIWDTSHIVPDVPFYHPRGMFIAYECPNVHFNRLKVTGINRPNRHVGADQWQDGDCSLDAYNSDNAIFSNNICSNNYAWGICSFGGSNGTAYGNTISYCTHQSGINICTGSVGGVATIYDNKISECGLYGVEYENRGAYDIECYSNVVKNCYMGILILSQDHTLQGTIHNNITSECLIGIAPLEITNAQNSLTISQNTVSDSQYAINVSAVLRTNVIDNILTGFYSKDTYLHISPSNFVAEVLAPNKFLTHKSLITEFGATVGSVYYIDERQITITNISDNTAAWSYGNTPPDSFSVITIAESILDNQSLMKHLKRKYVAGGLGLMGIQSLGSNKNVVFSGNLINGYNYGFIKDNANLDVNYTETITNNTFLNNIVDVLNTAATMGIKYIDNNFTGNLGFHRNLVEQGNVTLHPVVSQKLGIARATTSEAVKSSTIYLPQKTRINAVSISVIGMNTTGKLRVTLNGETLEALVVGNNVLLYCNHLLNAGAHTVTISDSVGDLTYTDVFLGLLTT